MLFPVRALARHVRGGLVSRLRAAAAAGKLERIAAGEVDAVLDRLMRHFGFLANRCRKRCLAQIRSALAAAPPDDAGDDEDGAPAEMTLPCPKCRRGRMHAVSTLPARPPMRGHSRLYGG